MRAGARRSGSAAGTQASRGGYGHGIDIASSKRFLGDVRLTIFAPHAGRVMTPTLGPGTWYRGSVALIGEGAVLRARRPTRGYAVGIAFNARYNFLGAGRLVPFVEAGAGPLYLRFRNENQADGLNFILQGGGGTQLFVTDRLALFGGVRFHHISNSALRRPNPGINDILFHGGLTYYLP